MSEAAQQSEQPPVGGVGPRERLLDAAIEYVAANGMGELSLRRLAAGIGTSHRMLIHHFGSKAQLRVAIVQAVEARQRELLADLLPDAAEAPGEQLWTWWKHISAPALWPQERLFFELYGQALQGRAGAAGMLEGVVERWVEPVAAQGVAEGRSPALAHAQARLGIAVTRGLLLDLLATGEVEAVDEAMRAFIEIYSAAQGR